MVLVIGSAQGNMSLQKTLLNCTEIWDKENVVLPLILLMSTSTGIDTVVSIFG